MNWYPPPRPSTPAERAVIVWVIIVVLSVAGAVLLWLGTHAPAGKAQQAGQAVTHGLACLACAFAAWVLYRVFNRWIES